MFDLGTLKKPQAAIHAVRHGSIEKRSLNDPTLGIAAVKHRDLVSGGNPFAAIAVTTIAQELLDFLNHPMRLGQVARGLHHPNRLTCPLCGVQVFTQTGFVVLDQFVGCVQDMAVAAVVLFQFDLVLDRVLAHKVSHIAHPCTAKSINALIVITHGQHRAARTTEQLDPSVLKTVGVLKFINQYMREALLVVLAQCIVVAQEFVTAQHQLAKVHHPLALTLVFVELVDFHLLARLSITHWHVFGTLAFFFATRNKPLQLLRRKAFVINVVLLDQTFHRRQLVLGVQNLKRLG